MPNLLRLGYYVLLCINPFSPTLLLIVRKMSLPERLGPYWFNPPF